MNGHHFPESKKKFKPNVALKSGEGTAECQFGIDVQIQRRYKLNFKPAGLQDKTKQEVMDGEPSEVRINIKHQSSGPFVQNILKFI